MPPVVTIIVCTMAEAQRRESLLRALVSAHAASLQPLQLTVVVNGQRCDPELI